MTKKDNRSEKARGGGDGIKPGVERAAEPQEQRNQIQSPRSGRQLTGEGAQEVQWIFRGYKAAYF